ncbi:unnamed protein product [marine sediment metagenome]|uniref:Uncharacterized protein n=1 Tax=marine sediment metagenome TaxID=412755 RepID=X1KGT0_9ZZZZ
MKVTRINGKTNRAVKEIAILRIVKTDVSILRDLFSLNRSAQTTT